MVTIFVHRDGRTERAPAVEPAWLDPAAPVSLWVDLASPTPDESRLLGDVFGFHELAVEDASSALQYPKVEAYDGYLYLVLHGIDFRASEHAFATHDVDFFLGRNLLVTVHDGNRRSVEEVRALCDRSGKLLADGPVAVLHRIVDSLVDHYAPEVDKLEDRLDAIRLTCCRRPMAARSGCCWTETGHRVAAARGAAAARRRGTARTP
jgi:magnesium transporter